MLIMITLTLRSLQDPGTICGFLRYCSTFTALQQNVTIDPLDVLYQNTSNFQTFKSTVESCTVCWRKQFKYLKKGIQTGQFHFLFPLRLISCALAFRSRMNKKFNLFLKLKPMFVCLFWSIAQADRRGSVQATLICVRSRQEHVRTPGTRFPILCSPSAEVHLNSTDNLHVDNPASMCRLCPHIIPPPNIVTLQT